MKVLLPVLLGIALIRAVALGSIRADSLATLSVRRRRFLVLGLTVGLCVVLWSCAVEQARSRAERFAAQLSSGMPRAMVLEVLSKEGVVSEIDQRGGRCEFHARLIFEGTAFVLVEFDKNDRLTYWLVYQRGVGWI